MFYKLFANFTSVLLFEKIFIHISTFIYKNTKAEYTFFTKQFKKHDENFLNFKGHSVVI